MSYQVSKIPHSDGTFWQCGTLLVQTNRDNSCPESVAVFGKGDVIKFSKIKESFSESDTRSWRSRLTPGEWNAEQLTDQIKLRCEQLDDRPGDGAKKLAELRELCRLLVEVIDVRTRPPVTKSSEE